MIADGLVEFRKGQAFSTRSRSTSTPRPTAGSHEVGRVRKLLLHKHEIDKLGTKTR